MRTFMDYDGVLSQYQQSFNINQYKKRRNMKMKYFLICLAISVTIALGYNYIIPTFGDYSTGDRSGIVQKITHKGFFFKTYEGELATEGIKVTTSVGSTFEFSVIDENIVKQLDSLVGQRVVISYTEKFHVNKFQGNTDYIVTSVKVLK